MLTVTSTVPEPAGDLAVSLVADTNVTVGAGLEPNATSAEAVKLVPVIVTAVPPAVGPAIRLSAVTVGAGAYV